ncbi:hypothetical protein L209DRAFT_332770 [Thermothelomyces heterothallicus CBS 203.75]
MNLIAVAGGPAIEFLARDSDCRLQRARASRGGEWWGVSCVATPLSMYATRELCSPSYIQITESLNLPKTSYLVFMLSAFPVLRNPGPVFFFQKNSRALLSVTALQAILSRSELRITEELYMPWYLIREVSIGLRTVKLVQKDPRCLAYRGNYLHALPQTHVLAATVFSG